MHARGLLALFALTAATSGQERLLQRTDLPARAAAAARIDRSNVFAIPQEVWDGLDPATYYIRFLERKSLRVLRTVSVTRTEPARLPASVEREAVAAV